MQRLASRLRKPAIVFTGLASAALCMTLIWVFAPGLFGGLRTGELLVMLGLIVLPAVTWLAIRADRREAERRRAAVPRIHEGGRVVRDSEERTHRHDHAAATSTPPGSHELN